MQFFVFMVSDDETNDLKSALRLLRAIANVV